MLVIYQGANPRSHKCGSREEETRQGERPTKGTLMSGLSLWKTEVQP